MNRNVTFRADPKILATTCPRRGFTLVELMTVVAIVAILMSLVVFGISSLKGAQDMTKSAYVLAGALEQARSYAMANNTYAWVGFFEEDGSKSSTNPATNGIGRLVISLVASQNGTRYSDSKIDATHPAAFGKEDPASTATTITNKVLLAQISPLIKLGNIHMIAVNNATGNTPVRPVVASAYQVGDSGTTVDNSGGAFTANQISGATNPTTFTFPLTVFGVAQTPQYTFTKIIEFSPQGEASKIGENVFSGPGPQNQIEIALQPTHGTVVDPIYTASPKLAAAAIQVEGLSGQVRTYRP